MQVRRKLFAQSKKVPKSQVIKNFLQTLFSICNYKSDQLITAMTQQQLAETRAIYDGIWLVEATTAVSANVYCGRRKYFP